MQCLTRSPEHQSGCVPSDSPQMLYGSLWICFRSLAQKPSQLTSGIIRVCHYSAGDFRSKEITVLMIRLARRGARKQPHYRVVVIEKESARNGRPVEVVGTYNPRTSPASVELKRDRVDYWVAKGAKMSGRVSEI